MTILADVKLGWSTVLIEKFLLWGNWFLQRLNFYRNTNYNFKMVRGCLTLLSIVTLYPTSWKIFHTWNTAHSEIQYFPNYLTKNSKKEAKLIYFDFFIRKQRNKLKRDFELQARMAPGSGILADFWVPHEIDSWNFQQMLDLWFSEASQNLSSFRQLLFSLFHRGDQREKFKKSLGRHFEFFPLVLPMKQWK